MVEQVNVNSKNIISLHFGKNANAVGSALLSLEARQIFDLDDPLNHKALFSNLESRKPRALFFDNKFSFDILQYLNSIPKKAQKPENEISLLWDTSKINNKTEEGGFNEMKKEEYELKKSIYDNFLLDSKQMIRVENFFENDFSAFNQGNLAFKGPEGDETYLEPARKLLESTDYISGFHIFADCDKGFGSFCHQMTQLLKEECQKTAQVMFPIFDSRSIGEKNLVKLGMQIVNELISYSAFRENSTIIIPFDFSTTLNCGYFNEKSLLQGDLCKAASLSPILSTITYPYRLKAVSQDTKDYFDNIIPNKDMNIYNVAYSIPSEEKRKYPCISKYKNYISVYPTLMQTLGIQKRVASTYSEAYMIRGYGDDIPDIKLVSNRFDLKAEKVILAWPEKHPSIFSEHIYEVFGQGKDFNLPFHTCLFSNETIGKHLTNLIKEYRKNVSYASKIQFLKDDNCTEETLKEMIEDIEIVIDAYSENLERNIESDN